MSLRTLADSLPYFKRKPQSHISDLSDLLVSYTRTSGIVSSHVPYNSPRDCHRNLVALLTLPIKQTVGLVIVMVEVVGLVLARVGEDRYTRVGTGNMNQTVKEKEAHDTLERAFLSFENISLMQVEIE